MYLQEMGEWNNEIQQVLTQVEEQEWKHAISMETIAMVPADVVNMMDANNMWEELKKRMKSKSTRSCWRNVISYELMLRRNRYKNKLLHDVNTCCCHQVCCNICILMPTLMYTLSLYLQPDLEWSHLKQAWDQGSPTDNSATVNLFYGATNPKLMGEHV